MAAYLIVGNRQTKKTMAGQFLSSHQRFFKYLCIASKVKHVCQVAEENQRMGKCIAICLTSYCSTGESTVASQPASQPGSLLSDRGFQVTLMQVHIIVQQSGAGNLALQ